MNAKILLVDDRDENLVALEAMLRRPDVTLVTARSGLEALELLLKEEFALALLDVEMPGMDGFELAELMRGSQRSASIPIIFVTAGVTDTKRVFRGYDLGAVDYLYKPLDPLQLTSKADTFLQLHRKSQELQRALSDREAALKLNEQLVSVLVDDLRNPLRTIMAGCDRLAVTMDDEQSRTLDAIASSARQLERMVVKVLDYVKISRSE